MPNRRPLGLEGERSHDLAYYLKHRRRSSLSLILASAVVCHCIFDQWSSPPAQRGTM